MQCQGYFAFNFSCMKNVPKQTKKHLNEIGLTETEFCKNHIQFEAASKFAAFQLFVTWEE